MRKYVKTFEIFASLVAEEARINRILDSYLECAIWTEQEKLEHEFEEDRYLSPGTASVDLISDESKMLSVVAIKKFLELAGDAIDGIEDNQLGHDIWLTRNGHGAGFSDRDYDSTIIDELEAAAKKLGSVDVWVGDDGFIHFSK